MNRGALWLARHWLLLANLFWAGYVGLPVLAPILMSAGWTAPSNAIYLLYRPLCHQRPERSFFVYGPQIAYSQDELAAAGIDVEPLARAIGSSAVGWKVAFCERDTAIYGAVLVGGLLYALFRRRLRRIRLPFLAYLVLLLPLAIDGTLQLVGLYESTWLARVLTGALFGGASVVFAYPVLDESFADFGPRAPASRGA